MEEDYIGINKNSWNSKVDLHFNSVFYNVPDFLQRKNSLKEIELMMLGDIKGKSILHLQCHFGMDSISLATLGAEVVGVDFSDRAIAKAEELNNLVNADAKFICSDVYSLPSHLHQKFDIVFTSYGTIGWLPDLNRWASVISHFLKDNGRFVFVEFHPIAWMFDDHFEKIHYGYFNSGKFYESQLGTYAETNDITSFDYVWWNHSTSEVLNSLLRNGMQLKSFDEFDYSPYDCFKRTKQLAPDKFVIEHLQNKIPLVFSLEAIKKMI
ncbi:MAG: class I SAM-dependent methyltransferase [Saprospiraceae bacterium]|nr:class I SAM-dependent methyltransferase [Saprospiraceae bacterium]